MDRTTNNLAFTLTELMMAVAFSVLLMTGVYGFYTTSSQVYSAGISGQNLQQGANIVLSKITEGEPESGTSYSLATAVSFIIPNGTAGALYTCGGGAQTTPCNAVNTFSELYYCQDSNCSSSDATARWYYLNSAGTSVIYHHPNAAGGTVEETIYTAPTGSLLKLRFAQPQLNGQNIPNVVEVDVDLTGNLSANVTNTRVATSGDVSTFVLLRDHS